MKRPPKAKPRPSRPESGGERRKPSQGGRSARPPEQRRGPGRGEARPARRDERPRPDDRVSEPLPERRARRALSHVGGRIEKSGADQRVLEALEHALAVRADEAATLAHVHGFHSYPARLHPETAARLVSRLSEPGNVVLDPFCGSGTVLVEAHRLGRRALGVDANPLAVELCWLKTRGFDARERAELLETARQVAEHAEARRGAKAGPTRRYGPEDRALFDVHVLLELDGIRDGIAKLSRGDTARALSLVLSAILTKASKRPGDTAERTSARRLPGGFVIRFFVKKTEELTRRLLEYAAQVPHEAPAAAAFVGDARRLQPVRSSSVSLVVTSPPYPGVYDYHSHHAARLRWLGLDDRRFEETEIGARRHAREGGMDFVVREWRRDFGACLSEMRRVLAPGGRAAIVIADSAVAGRALHADVMVRDLAEEAGLSLVARASQPRPLFHGPSQRAFHGRPRHEHVLVLASVPRR